MKIPTMFAFLILVTAFCVAPIAKAQTEFSCDPGFGSLPSNDPKYPANQLILICKPANWNGDLMFMRMVLFLYRNL